MGETSGELTLWGVGTSRTLRAHWALQELGLAYEVRDILSRSGETQTEEFRRLNPSEKIPVLQHGDLRLAESAAIVAYLFDAFGAERELAPPAPGTPDRALHDQWCYFAAMELDATALYVIRRHEGLPEIYGEAPRAVEAAREYYRRQVRVADAQLADGRPYLLGDRFGGADVLLVSCLIWAHFLGEKHSDGLGVYQERLTEREGYQQAFRANFPPKALAALRAPSSGS